MHNPQKNTSEPVTTVGDVLSWLIHWKLFVFLGVVKAWIASTQQELHQLCALHLAHPTAPSTLRCTGWSYPFKPCTTTTESAGKGIGALSGGRENADGQDEGCNYINKVGRFSLSPCSKHMSDWNLKCWKVKLVRSGPGSFNKKQGLLICLWKRATCRVIF